MSILLHLVVCRACRIGEVEVDTALQQDYRPSERFLRFHANIQSSENI